MERKRGRTLIALFLAALSFWWSGCSGEPDRETAGRTTYNFLVNSGDAEINTAEPEYVRFRQAEFIINNDKRVILFEHPTSEVLFKRVPVDANAVLQFGIGINQTAWDKAGDGVSFEVIIVDEKSRKISVFSKYIDPKKNAEDRKWFDYNVDLQAVAGQEVSFIFKTGGGSEGNVEYDWAGWSNPQIVSEGDKGWIRRLWSMLS